jgi:hypothetical protein
MILKCKHDHWGSVLGSAQVSCSVFSPETSIAITLRPRFMRRGDGSHGESRHREYILLGSSTLDRLITRLCLPDAASEGVGILVGQDPQAFLAAVWKTATNEIPGPRPSLRRFPPPLPPWKSGADHLSSAPAQCSCTTAHESALQSVRSEALVQIVNQGRPPLRRVLV